MSAGKLLDAVRFRVGFLIIFTLFSALFGPQLSAAGPLDTANVMAPLLINDAGWSTFEDQLTTVKNYGVDAVSVDVWWGIVEGSGDNAFDWSYYDKLFSTIKSHGLKIAPILSFHQCGGDVGDACNIPLPPWLWTKYIGKTFNGIKVNDTDLEYESEQGHFSRETVQLWADPLVVDEYAAFVAKFKDHFAPTYNNDIIEINVSTGPSGELRYPSYNAHDNNTGYPTRGALQSYSRLAVQDFQSKMLNKYGDLSGVNKAWGTNLTDAGQIQPPSNADYFFSHGDYKDIQYGKDFVDWYNQSLVDHGKTMVSDVINALGGSFPSARIAYKIPGVHWTMTNPSYPRAAEVAAGLIQTSADLNSDAAGHGYANIVGLAKVLASGGRDIVLDFTCLEMDNQDFPPQYSLAKNLVFWVANEASRQGVTIKGENALSGGITNDSGWNNIANAFDYASYTGLTTLRIGDVAQGTGQARYADFIRRRRSGPASGNNVWYFRGTPNGWGSTSMNRVDGSDDFDLVVTFAREDPNPRFKIDHFGDWKESYPPLDQPVADCARYEIRFNQAAKQIQVPPDKLEDVTVGACASGDSLSPGAAYRPEATTFSLWSPDTSNVQLWLDGELYPMKPLPGGEGPADVYTVTVPGDHHLKRYNFRVAGRIARDPYGVMVEPGTNNNVVLNLALTEPAGGWAPRPPLKAREDAVIYEMHVRDFTIDPSSGVDSEKRGKFLGMVQPGTKFQGQTTGLDHLKELGITHVQIMPFFDFQSCSGAPPQCYNWGYDPLNFNVPEERYSLHPDDPVERIRELKTMINEFHKAGIRVIMDVVYNHTAGGSTTETTFSPITSQYFLSSDITGTGNTVDDRKPMVSRFIRDSLAFWTREYHVDGFRFDLMGAFDYAAVGDWGRYLNKQFPDAMLLIYGEPWECCGNDPYPEADRVRLGDIGRIVDAHVGAFNDQYRKALKGENDSSAGGGYIFNQPGGLFSIQAGSRGAIRYKYDPTQSLPNLWDQMFANNPEQTINYVSAHDNLILRDKVLVWADDNNAANNQGYLKRIQEFADGVILTSQGIPFIQAGDEMLRNKQRNKNSYDAPDSVNAIRWQWKIDNADVVDYHRQVIAMRKNHPGFRLTTWDQIDKNIKTDDGLRYGVVVNRINAVANEDDWGDIIVIYNSADNFEYPLPDGTWFVAMEKSDPGAGKDRPVTAKVIAEGTAVTVLHR